MRYLIASILVIATLTANVYASSDIDNPIIYKEEGTTTYTPENKQTTSVPATPVQPNPPAQTVTEQVTSSAPQTTSDALKTMKPKRDYVGGTFNFKTRDYVKYGDNIFSTIINTAAYYFIGVVVSILPACLMVTVVVDALGFLFPFTLRLFAKLPLQLFSVVCGELHGIKFVGMGSTESIFIEKKDIGNTMRIAYYLNVRTFETFTGIALIMLASTGYLWDGISWCINMILTILGAA